MIRSTLMMLLLGTVILVDPGFGAADKKPSSPPPKPAPQIVQPPTPPSKSSRQHRDRQTYHPHTSKGSGSHSKRTAGH